MLAVPCASPDFLCELPFGIPSPKARSHLLQPYLRSYAALAMLQGSSSRPGTACHTPAALRCVALRELNADERQQQSKAISWRPGKVTCRAKDGHLRGDKTSAIV